MQYSFQKVICKQANGLQHRLPHKPLFLAVKLPHKQSSRKDEVIVDNEWSLTFIKIRIVPIFVFKKFLLEDIDSLQWKLEPPLEGEEKDDVEINEMLKEIESFVQRMEDLAVEVNGKSKVQRGKTYVGFQVYSEGKMSRQS